MPLLFGEHIHVCVRRHHGRFPRHDTPRFTTRHDLQPYRLDLMAPGGKDGSTLDVVPPRRMTARRVRGFLHVERARCASSFRMTCRMMRLPSDTQGRILR